MAETRQIIGDGLLDPEPDWVVGYEFVDGKLRAMDEARHRAFVQEGIDSYERDGGIPHATVMAEMRALIATFKA